MPEPEEPPLTARAKKPRRVVTARTFLLLVGTLIMLLICVIPLWDAMRLLDEPTFVYFLGRRWPRLMIISCVSSIVLYAVIVIVFFKYSRVEYKTEQTIMMIGMIVCTGLGLALLCISQPLANQTLAAYSDLFFQCDYGADTQRLYEYSMVLQLLRARPECASLPSVEQCAGYQESQPYTGFLRTLEGRYKCSGFCVDSRVAMNLPSMPLANATGNATANATGNATGDASEVSNVTLLAVSSHVRTRPSQGSGKLALALQRLSSRRALKRLEDRGVGELSVEHRDQVLREQERNDELLREEEEPAAGRLPPTSSAYQPGVLDDYPPTLFSKANYRVSCEGQAARVLKYEALDVARVLYIEGLALLFTTVFITMVKLAGVSEFSMSRLFFGSSSGGSRKPKEVIL